VSVFAYLSSAWRECTHFDGWVNSVGWVDVREIWGYGSGAWRLLYRRASAIGATKLFIDDAGPLLWQIDWTTGGTAIGTVGYEVLVNSVVQASGTTTEGATNSFTVPATSINDTVILRFVNVRGRIFGTVAP
jgi:hypothetical protein